jgi:DNA polymerase-3 subunit epsilon
LFQRVESIVNRRMKPIAAADVYLKMLPLPGGKGIRSLGQAREASEKTYHARITY